MRHKITLISEQEFGDGSIHTSSVSMEEDTEDIGSDFIEDWLLHQGLRGIGYVSKDD